MEEMLKIISDDVHLSFKWKLTLHQCCMQCAFQQMWQIIQIYGYMVFLYIWHTAEIIGFVSECRF